MFENKKAFTEEFVNRANLTYARNVTDMSDFELYSILGGMVRDYSWLNWKESKVLIKKQESRQLYYFSMEFLVGRLLTSNLMNLGIYDVVRDGLKDLNIDINHLEQSESDAGLGNGGLGRLAACFLDSIASLKYPGHGNCLRYNYGFFKQRFVDGYQVEEPDPWLFKGNVWEVRKPDNAVDVAFWGNVEATEVDGKIKYRHVDPEYVRAVPYDMPVIGAKTHTTNKLRLWWAEPSENYPRNKDFRQYEKETREICEMLYPDDTSRDGKILRLKQQYFFVSAGLQGIIRRHLRYYPNLDNFHEKNVLQINDTHPALLVAELMRILVDKYEYSWDKAWQITTQSLAYTNHTILAEALEKWPVDIIQPLLPRVYMIIEEINKRFCLELLDKYHDPQKVYRMAIIADNQVRMAHLAIVGSYSVNGVAQLHTDILVETEMKEWSDHYPGKFNNKTNGITHRRWFAYSNPQLANAVTRKIGDGWFVNPEAEFEKLLAQKDNKEFLAELAEIKTIRKQVLADHIKKTQGIELDVNSIFDIQVKRLHAYKRQLLNALHIMYIYNRLKEDKTFRDNYKATTFIFGAKAAPGYVFAKKVIKLINAISEKVNNDADTNHLLKVVFVENYNVSYAELIMSAADVSEQISTAGYEASGTGNMKFMMNGAITLGTMDGANVEIHGLVDDENIAIFGMTKDEVQVLKDTRAYNSRDYYYNDPRLNRIINQLVNGFFDKVPHDEFRLIYDELVNKDEYFILKDFDSYVQAQERINTWYKDQMSWQASCLVNIAKSGFFSSDRTIEDYVTDIWHLDKLEI